MPDPHLAAGTGTAAVVGSYGRPSGSTAATTGGGASVAVVVAGTTVATLPASRSAGATRTASAAVAGAGPHTS